MKEEKKWMIALLSLGIGFIALVLATNFVTADLEQQQKANAKTLSQLEEDLAEYEDSDDSDDSSAEESSEEEQEALVSAKEAGEEVAEYQNAYAGLSATDDREAYEANVEAMDALLSESAKSARVRWNDSELSGTWTFITDGEFSGDTVGVLWLCQNSDDNSLIAYATGTYEVENGTFSNIHYGLSSQAADSVAYEDNGIEDDGELTVDDLPIDEIKDADTGDIPDQSDEDLSDIRDAQEQLREQNQ